MGSALPYPPGFTLIGNKLATHKLSLLRDVGCEPQRFRRLVRQLGFLLCADATRDLPLTEERTVTTPAGATLAVNLVEQERFLILVLLRAGLVLAEGFQELLPRAAVGHFGFVPAATADGVEPYLVTIPEGSFSTIFLVGSAITSGRSMVAAVNLLIGQGFPLNSFRIATILASRQGIDRLYAAHKGITTFAVACDEAMTKSGEVVPGFGKAGNRVFGTRGVYDEY